jgi:hypothetical protein
MNGTRTRTFILSVGNERRQAMAAVAEAPSDFTVELKPTKRTDDQNRRFHAMVGDIARSWLPWAGKRRSAAQWKVLLVSGHAVATKDGSGEIVPGLESEFVNLRESTALMSVRRGASLIEYTRAFGDMNGVAWSEPETEEMGSTP